MGNIALASLGVDPEGLFDLWNAVREKFAKLTPRREIGPGVFDSTLIKIAAAMMARPRGSGCDNIG
jgi:hypothetical protein